MNAQAKAAKESAKSKAEYEKDIVRLNGNVYRGVIRGRELIDRFSDRIVGLLGFKPFPGTLNIRVEKPVNIEDFETKRLEHILLDGSIWIDVRLAPVKLTAKEKTVSGWIIFEERGLHNADVIEIIHKESLTDVLGLKYGDAVSIELRKVRRTMKSRIKEALRPVVPKATRIHRM